MMSSAITQQHVLGVIPMACLPGTVFVCVNSVIISSSSNPTGDYATLLQGGDTSDMEHHKIPSALDGDYDNRVR